MKNINHVCDICHKKDATVHYKKTVNGKTNEYYLCADCAAESDIANEINSTSKGLFDSFSGFDSLFSNFFFDTPYLGAATKQKRCPTCGFTLDDISAGSRLGCADCYDFFASELNLKPLISGGSYRGRHPRLIRKDKGESRAEAKQAKAEEKQMKAEAKAEMKAEKNELESLKAQLAEALKNENYELCAKLRDQIKEKGGNK